MRLEEREKTPRKTKDSEPTTGISNVEELCGVDRSSLRRE